MQRNTDFAQPDKRESHRGARIALKALGALAAVVLVSVVSLRLYINVIDAKLKEDFDERVENVLQRPEAYHAKTTTSTTEATTSGTEMPEIDTSMWNEPFYVLILGVDHDAGRDLDTENYGPDKSAYRSDTILLCRIDPMKKRMALVSIHRDTYVDLPDGTKGKINAAYSIGGAPEAIKMVSKFAGVPIAHYAEVDIDGVAAIIDSVGGVDVNLPVPVKDPEYTGLDLPKGEQHLDGKTAALFIRCRHGYDEYGDGDRYRAANQRMVISKLAEKLMKSDLLTMSNTILTAADHITTDMKTDDAISLAAAMLGMDPKTDISSGMEPTEGAYFDDTWYEMCDETAWKKMMKRVDDGLAPYEEGQVDSTDGVAGTVD